VRLLAMVRTLIKATPDDVDLILPYELTLAATAKLADALELAIDPDLHHYYFEASDAADVSLEQGIATPVR
jgi:hypothetical protein